jgi:hypothetical protein
MMDPFGTNPAEQADGLLRFAAEWEPDTPAPEDFTDRVLQRLESERAGERAQRRRLNRAAAFVALFLAGGTVCATATLAFAYLNAPRPLVPVGSAVHAVQQNPAPEDEQPQQTPLAPQVAVRAIEPEPQRSAVQLVGHGRTVEPREEAPAPIWEEETVREPVTRLKSPALWVQQGPEKGSWVVTPGTLDVVIQDQGTSACAPAPAPQDQQDSPGDGSCSPTSEGTPAGPDQESH